MNRLKLLGVDISTTCYGAVVDECTEWINQRRRSEPESHARYICVTSVHGIMAAKRDSELRSIINRADIVTPDGMPIVWALRSLGQRGQQRVYGPNLMLALCQEAAERGHRIFLYGSRPEVLLKLQQNLKDRYPRLTVVGTCPDLFRAPNPEEKIAIKKTILNSNCDLLFVGIGEPKQNHWMATHLSSFPGVVMVGLGAAFDFHAGQVRQAPPFIQNSGFEWLFRLLHEPKRLWKRYLLITPPFLPYWAIQWVKTLFGTQLRQNILSGTIMSAVGCLLIFVAYPAYLRSLGYEAYGIWLLLNTITTFSQLGNLGIAQALSRQLSEEVGANNLGAVSSCITTALFAMLCAGLFTVLFFCFGCRALLVPFLYPSQIAFIAPLLPWIGVASACAMVAEVIAATACGLGRMDLYNYAQCATQGLGIVASVVFLRSGLGIISLLLGNLTTAICLAILGSCITKFLAGSYLISYRRFSFKRLRALAGYGTGLAGNSLFTLLFSPLNRLIIARYAGVASVPLYDIAFNSSMRLRNIFEAGQRALLPEIGRFASAPPGAAYDRARQLGSQILRAFVWVIPIYSIGFIAAPPALKLWLGPRYNLELALDTRIILVGTFFSLVGTPAFYILAGLGRLKTLLFGNAIQSLSNILLLAFSLLIFHTLSASVVLSTTAFAMLCSTIFLLLNSSRLKQLT